MEQTFEMALARQCAPTLAGIKPANLFPWKNWKQARLDFWRKNLSPYGIELRILKACPVNPSGRKSADSPESGPAVSLSLL